MKTLKDRCIEILLEKGMITHEDLDKIMSLKEEEGVNFGELLVKMGYISKKDFMLILSSYFKIPPIRLSQIKIPQHIIGIFSPQMAKKFRAIPMGKIADTLTVAISDPLNIFALDDLESIVGCRIIVILGIYHYGYKI